jgi:hypothetical protein
MAKNKILKKLKALFDDSLVLLKSAYTHPLKTLDLINKDEKSLLRYTYAALFTIVLFYPLSWIFRLIMKGMFADFQVTMPFTMGTMIGMVVLLLPLYYLIGAGFAWLVIHLFGRKISYKKVFLNSVVFGLLIAPVYYFVLPIMWIGLHHNNYWTATVFNWAQFLFWMYLLFRISEKQGKTGCLMGCLRVGVVLLVLLFAGCSGLVYYTYRNYGPITIPQAEWKIYIKHYDQQFVLKKISRSRMEKSLTYEFVTKSFPIHTVVLTKVDLNKKEPNYFKLPDKQPGFVKQFISEFSYRGERFPLFVTIASMDKVFKQQGVTSVFVRMPINGQIFYVKVSSLDSQENVISQLKKFLDSLAIPSIVLKDIPIPPNPFEESKVTYSETKVQPKTVTLNRVDREFNDFLSGVEQKYNK